MQITETNLQVLQQRKEIAEQHEKDRAEEKKTTTQNKTGLRLLSKTKRQQQKLKLKTTTTEMITGQPKHKKRQNKQRNPSADKEADRIPQKGEKQQHRKLQDETRLFLKEQQQN